METLAFSPRPPISLSLSLSLSFSRFENGNSTGTLPAPAPPSPLLSLSLTHSLLPPFFPLPSLSPLPRRLLLLIYFRPLIIYREGSKGSRATAAVTMGRKRKARAVDEDSAECTEEFDGDGGDYGCRQGSCIPLGCRFDPTDQILLGFYLPMKAAGVVPPIQDFIPTCDLYAPGAEPWFLHPAASISPSSLSGDDFFLPRHRGEWFYCYALTTRSGSGACRRAGSGTWVANGKLTAVANASEKIMGYKMALTFKLFGGGGGAKGVSTGWVMHEFRRRRSSDNSLVLCRIRCRGDVGLGEMSHTGPQLQFGGPSLCVSSPTTHLSVPRDSSYNPFSLLENISPVSGGEHSDFVLDDRLSSFPLSVPSLEQLLSVLDEERSTFGTQ